MTKTIRIKAWAVIQGKQITTTMLYPDPEMLYVYKEKPPEEDVKYWKLTVVPITITFTIPKHK